jgi:hypothetical protein
MADKAKIEEEIRQVLASDLDAVSMSNRLFSQGGLFSLLGSTEEERRAIIQTTLFQEAHHYISELQRLEREAFTKAVKEARAQLAKKKKLEQVETEG